MGTAVRQTRGTEADIFAFATDRGPDRIEERFPNKHTGFTGAKEQEDWLYVTFLILIRNDGNGLQSLSQHLDNSKGGLRDVQHFCLLKEIRTEEIPDLFSERGRRRGRTFCWRELRILVPGVPSVQHGEAQV